MEELGFERSLGDSEARPLDAEPPSLPDFIVLARVDLKKKKSLSVENRVDSTFFSHGTRTSLRRWRARQAGSHSVLDTCPGRSA